MPKKIPIEEKLERKVGPEICRELIAYAKRTGETIENLAAVLLADPPRRKDLENSSMRGDDYERKFTDKETRIYCERVTGDHNTEFQRLQGERFKYPSACKTGGIEDDNADYLQSFDRECYPHGRLHTPKNPIHIFRVYLLNLIRPRRHPYAHKIILYYRIPPSGDILEYSWWLSNRKNLRTSVNLQKTKFLEVKAGKPIEVVDVKTFTLPLKPCPSPTIWERLPPRISEDRFKERYEKQNLYKYIQKTAHNFARGDNISVSDLEQEAWDRVDRVESDDIEVLKIEARRAINAARNRKNQLSFDKNTISLDDYLDRNSSHFHDS